jgi:hypothetical protein
VLTDAVIEAARHTADGEWGQAPRLYALATREALDSAGGTLPETVRSASGSSLIPIEQDPLPAGDPEEFLATLQWPDEVAGCVLTTDVLIDSGEAGGEPAGRQGRLTVGVLRDGGHACCLQLEGEAELIVAPGLADDLVTALLGTLQPVPARGTNRGEPA